MKIEKWRELTQDDLKRKLVELRDNLLKTKVKVQTKQVENSAQLSSLRRDIARIETLLREMERTGITTPVAAAPQRVPEQAPAKPEAKEKPAVKEKAAAKAKK